jgi:PAS domain S-box-containing protein
MPAVSFLESIRAELDGDLGAIMQSLPDGIAMIDATGAIVFANDRLQGICQFRSDELIGRAVETLVPGALSDAHQEHREQYLSRPGHRPMGIGLDVHLRRADGTTVPVDIQLSSVTVGSGSYVLASVRDISEKKEIDEALRESEERFRTFVEAAPVMIFSLLPDGVIHTVNREFETKTGWRRADLIGTHFAPFVHPDDLADALVTLGRFIRHEKIDDHGVRVLTATGAYLETESTLVPLYSQGKAVEVLGVIHDVSEQKRAEKKLHQTKERFLQVFKQGPLAIALIDLDLRITNANHALCHFLGQSREDLVGSTFMSLIHPDDRDADAELGRQLAEGTLPSYRTEQRYITKNGDVVRGMVTASMILDESGQPQYGMRTVEDVTERRHLEREAASESARAMGVLTSLTPRESEVLELLAEVSTASELAKRLFVSTRTVESHLSHAYKKLGVRSRTDALEAYAAMKSLVTFF